MRLELGRRIRCTDDELGELTDIVVDPVEKRVTHLVVKSRHGGGEAHLVPIELAEAGEGAEILLTCALADARALPNAEEFAYLRLGEMPKGDPDWDVGVTTPLALPYYESGGLDYGFALGQDLGMVYDRVPKGEVEVRRSSRVITTHGHYVGDVDGFLVDDEDHITHLVLERGHLWGRREVTVPIGAVARVESDAVTLSLSTDEIGALPAHKVHRWPLS